MEKRPVSSKHTPSLSLRGETRKREAPLHETGWMRNLFDMKLFTNGLFADRQHSNGGGRGSSGHQ